VLTDSRSQPSRAKRISEKDENAGLRLDRWPSKSLTVACRHCRREITCAVAELAQTFNRIGISALLGVSSWIAATSACGAKAVARSPIARRVKFGPRKRTPIGLISAPVRSLRLGIEFRRNVAELL
jgi:hypothetical protein